MQDRDSKTSFIVSVRVYCKKLCTAYPRNTKAMEVEKVALQW